MDMKEQAAELRAWQEAHGYSQAQMCAALHITRVTYSKWINARGPIPHWVGIALAHAEMQGVAPELATAATTKKRANKHNEWQATYRDGVNQPMSVEQRKALPVNALYWKSEPDGTWSEWQKAAPGFSDTFTGVITS